MSYRLDIRPDALADIEEAAKWYEEQQPGLGADFAHTVLRAIDSPAGKSANAPRARPAPKRALVSATAFSVPDRLSNAG